MAFNLAVLEPIRIASEKLSTYPKDLLAQSMFNSSKIY